VAVVASQGVLPEWVPLLSVPNPAGIWLAFPVSNLVAALIAFLWFSRGTWQDADLTDRGYATPEVDSQAIDD
jgi:Na+-driven multidrug efflux pump